MHGFLQNYLKFKQKFFTVQAFCRNVDAIVAKHSSFATIDNHEYLAIMGDILSQNYELRAVLMTGGVGGGWGVGGGGGV